MVPFVLLLFLNYKKFQEIKHFVRGTSVLPAATGNQQSAPLMQTSAKEDQPDHLMEYHELKRSEDHPPPTSKKGKKPRVEMRVSLGQTQRQERENHLTMARISFYIVLAYMFCHLIRIFLCIHEAIALFNVGLVSLVKEF